MRAAVPPHSAVRLCLTEEVALKSFPEAQPQEKKGEEHGKAEPYRTVRRHSRIGHSSAKR